MFTPVGHWFSKDCTLTHQKNKTNQQKNRSVKTSLSKSEEKSKCDQITYNFNVKISKSLHHQQNWSAKLVPL